MVAATFVRGSGFEPSTEAELAQVPEEEPAFGGGTCPNSDLTEWFPVPGDQGDEPSCVAWSIAYVRTYFEARKRHWDPSSSDHRFSARFIYNQLANSGKTQCTASLKFNEALSFTRESGIATESAFSPADCSQTPDSACLLAARENRIVGFRKVDVSDFASIKDSLCASIPVMFGAKLDARISGLRTSDCSGQDLGPVVEKHAMTIIGHDDSRVIGTNVGAFRVLNSRGSVWGGGGYAWISYAAFANIAMQAFTMYPANLVQAASKGVKPLVIVSGELVFDVDTTIRATKIVLASGSTIRIRNGSKLIVDSQQIVAETGSLIDGRGEEGQSGQVFDSRTFLAEDHGGLTNKDTIKRKAFEAQRLRLINGARGGPGATVILRSHPFGKLRVDLAGGRGGQAGFTEHKAGRQGDLGLNGTLAEQNTQGSGSSAPAKKE